MVALQETINPVTPVMDLSSAMVLVNLPWFTNLVHQVFPVVQFTGTISKENASISPVPVIQHI